MSESESEHYESADEEGGITTKPSDIGIDISNKTANIEKQMIDIKKIDKVDFKKEKEFEETFVSNDKNVVNAADGWDEDEWGDDWNDNEENEIKTDKISSVSVKGKTSAIDEGKKIEEDTVPPPNTWVWGGFSSITQTLFSSGVSSLSSVIGVPNPEELVEMEKKKPNQIEKQIDKDIVKEKEDSFLGFGNIVTGVTNIGTNLISNGLDTLEGIGKKTMNILQENDPLLLNKRKMIGLETEKPVLSQVLREAKEKSEEIERNLKQVQKKSYKKQIHFESLFDSYYGLVHLEALEMLSKQSELKMKTILDPLTGKALQDLKETMEEINELCDVDVDSLDLEDCFTSCELKEKLISATKDLGVQVTFDDIYRSWEENIIYLKNDSNFISQEIYERAIRCLAETCALQVNKMHKIAEMILIKEHHSTIFEADNLVQMTTIFCQHSKGIGNKFALKLNDFEQNEEVRQLVTNIYLEVCNCTSYIQSAFKLLIPIIQLGAV